MSSATSKPWVVIVGPTCVGKTGVAEDLASRFRTDIVVADSRQVYRGMDIGTNKPSLESCGRVPRRLINILPPDEICSAGTYRKMALREVADIEMHGNVVILEGGTGLYLKALLYGLWDGPVANWPLRRRLQMLEDTNGSGALHRRLAAVDPVSADKIMPQDLPKILRALEVHEITGLPLSSFHQRPKTPLVPCCMIGLRRKREDLYDRIERRVERQIADGLIAETEALLARFDPTLPSMQGLGYRQMIPYIQGKQTMEEAVNTLKRDTRRYAKRQLTWFLRDAHTHWIDLEEPEETGAAIQKITPLLTSIAY